LPQIMASERTGHLPPIAPYTTPRWLRKCAEKRVGKSRKATRMTQSYVEKTGFLLFLPMLCRCPAYYGRTRDARIDPEELKFFSIAYRSQESPKGE